MTAAAAAAAAAAVGGGRRVGGRAARRAPRPRSRGLDDSRWSTVGDVGHDADGGLDVACSCSVDDPGVDARPSNVSTSSGPGGERERLAVVGDRREHHVGAHRGHHHVGGELDRDRAGRGASPAQLGDDRPALGRRVARRRPPRRRRCSRDEPARRAISARRVEPLVAGRVDRVERGRERVEALEQHVDGRALERRRPRRAAVSKTSSILCVSAAIWAKPIVALIPFRECAMRKISSSVSRSSGVSSMRMTARFSVLQVLAALGEEHAQVLGDVHSDLPVDEGCAGSRPSRAGLGDALASSRPSGSRRGAATPTSRSCRRVADVLGEVDDDVAAQHQVEAGRAGRGRAAGRRSRTASAAQLRLRPPAAVGVAVEPARQSARAARCGRPRR